MVDVKSTDGRARLVNTAHGRIQLPNGEIRSYVAPQPLTPLSAAFEIYGSDRNLPPF